MAAPTNAANVKKALANPEPSTHGPLADFVSQALDVRLEPIQEEVESDESDVIPLRGADSPGACDVEARAPLRGRTP
jgi:hypothetical protein